MDSDAQELVLSARDYAYDDLRVGGHYETGGITITEAHIVGFAGISGDLFDVHMDDEFARVQGFPGRIAHGLLGLALADGLKTRCAVRILGIATLTWNWAFRKPIFIGNRIHVRIEVKDKRVTRRVDRGIVTLALQVLNQEKVVVQDGETQLMVRRFDIS